MAKSTILQLSYSGATLSGEVNNLGAKIAAQATDFTYTDVASGQSDSISISMHDIGWDWLKYYKPCKGAVMGVSIILQNEGSFECGDFVVDDVSFGRSSSPLKCSIGAVSVPVMNDFKYLQRTKTWESATLKSIADEIARSANVELYYDAGTIKIAELEQSSQTDSAFLYSLCERYGLGMKVYKNRIVIFDITAYEAKPAVHFFTEQDLTSWEWNETIDGTYTGVEFKYTDPDAKKKDSISVTIGSPGRMYYMNAQASSRHDAELQAKAKVNAANRSAETLNLTIPARPEIAATQCIAIVGLGVIDGKYYIDKVVHSIGGEYKMQLTTHRVQSQVGKSTAAKGTYTVVSGDCLWNIAKKYYGSGAKYLAIYNANKELIESTARAHGKKNSGNGHWIWPGMVLTIPEV